MNHKCALQRKSDGRWDYTYNGAATGYCSGPYEPMKETAAITQDMADRWNEKMQPHAHKFHEDGHATEQEARDCYRQYMLDSSLFLPAKEPPNATQAQKCQVCGVWTACIATVGSYSMFFLCPEHCTREHVEKLYRVGESWES